MSEIFVVIKREFLERVRTKSFLIGTFLFPLVIIGMYAIPFLVGSEGHERRIAVVDQAPAGVGDAVIARLTAPRNDPKENTYVIERIGEPFDQVRESLTSRVQNEELDGYVVLPADIVANSQISYRARNIANIDVLKDIEGAASSAVQAERLRSAGLDGAEVASLIRPVKASTARITEKGEEGGSAMSTFLAAYVVAFLIYFLTVFYGMAVLRSVLEEKTSRIAEVIVSSMKAGNLMAGKIIGVAAVALAQVALWGLFIGIIATQSDLITARFGIPRDALKAFSIAPSVALYFLAFFVLGFLLFAAIFAALGAAVNSEQEAQSWQFFVMMPLFLPMMFMVPITTDPLGQTASVLGMIPLTAPIVMPMRMAAGDVPTLQLVGSLVILVAAVAAVAWLAGKIYRVGILSTGQKPTLRELGRWLRAA